MKKKFFVLICTILFALFCFCGCNQQVFDSTVYEYAYIKVDGNWHKVDIVSWKQSYDTIWLFLGDGNSFSVHSNYCILVSGDLPFDID